ncbi:hypothetical protein TNCV_593791 [Trichonephila clavipes]|nr:hypothetical protein TNCV_593791 [Trichonephila clavipes]
MKKRVTYQPSVEIEQPRRNMDETLALERTMGQNCSEWHLERKLRLTASDTKLIISRVADFKTLTSQILKKGWFGRFYTSCKVRVGT